MNQVVENCISTQKSSSVMPNITSQQIELWQNIKWSEELMDRIGQMILKIAVLSFLGMVLSQIYHKIVI